MSGFETQSRESSLSLLEVLQRPGVQRIFVHDYEAPNVPSLRPSIDALACFYAERALLMAQRNDVVVVADQVDPTFLDYLRELEIGPTADRILATKATSEMPTNGRAADLLTLLGNPCALDRLAERVDPAHQLRLNPYFASPAFRSIQCRLEKRLGRLVTLEAGPPAAADRANRKEQVRCAAKELGVPTAPGEVVSWPETQSPPPLAAMSDAVARHRNQTGKVIIRGAWAMRGSDNLTLESESDMDRLREWLAQREHLRCYLVESFVPVTASPNLQMWIERAGPSIQVDLMHTTNQRFNDMGRHIGNAYPHNTELEPDLRASAHLLARWLAANGYTGPVGVDFIETVDRTSGNTAHLLAEINGRINGSTYVLALWSRINQVRNERRCAPINAWISNTNIRVQNCTFAQLCDQLGSHLYTHASRRGVVPYNTGLLKHGIMNAVILADSVEESEDIERDVLGRLSV